MFSPITQHRLNQSDDNVILGVTNGNKGKHKGGYNMIGIIGLLLSLVISLCWYLPCVRAQGENRVLDRKDYIRTALVYGQLFTCPSETPHVSAGAFHNRHTCRL